MITPKLTTAAKLMYRYHIVSGFSSDAEMVNPGILQGQLQIVALLTGHQMVETPPFRPGWILAQSHPNQ